MEYIGNLWKKQSSNPKAPFASGVVKVKGEEIRITVWDNSHRKREGRKDPDYSITLDEPRNPASQPVSTPQLPRKPDPAHAGAWDYGEGKPAPNSFTDDIPF